jgi:NADH:ubiquinone oxidoreductase subunit 5 (subunit L)/multisubunit Na+/H+ antiporter MnhA subunit
MSALKYLDPFPVLIVGSLVVVVGASVAVAIQDATLFLARTTVAALGLAIVVVAGLWVWRAVTHETSE